MKGSRTLLQIAFALLVVGAWFVTLRPASLGGSAGYVTIRGTSMEPTYVTGDLVITKKSATYAKGDIVAYRVPDGQFGEGIVVIHRIVGGSATDGFVILGDNNEFKDDWRPTPKDMVGKAWVHIPRLGMMLAFLHAPVPMAALASAVAVVLVVLPKKKETDERQPDADVVAMFGWPGSPSPS